MLHIDKWEGCGWEQEDLANYLSYSKNQEDIKDFVEWISNFLRTDKFYKIAHEFIDISLKLNTEPVGKKKE